MDYIALGERMRSERLKLNLTQEKIAQELDVSIDYLLLGIIKVKPDTFLNEVVSSLSNQVKKQVKTFLELLRYLLIIWINGRTRPL